MKPLVLLILDGWGIAPKSKGNAIELAKKPNFDQLWKNYPHTQLKAHGQYVGLPENQVGNSEAGHLNIGAGRVVKQDAVLISEAINDGRVNKNLALNQTIEHVIKNKSDLHLIGLVSDGESPHSSLDHLYAIVDLAQSRGIKKVYLHLITDGRDSPQFAAIRIIDEVVENIYGKAVVASIIGRYFAMDRGKNWERTQKAYDCLTLEKAEQFADYQSAILRAYNQKTTDEFIEPAIIAKNKQEARKKRIKDNDGVIFFNLRSDRARQLTKCFVQEQFNKMNSGSFKRIKVLKNIEFCVFTDFGPDLDHILTAFPSPDIKNSLPAMLKDLKQVYVSETEKYAHMTYFINGGYADAVNGEKRIRIVSQKIKSYASKPRMSAPEITKQVVYFLERKKYDFIAINFANPDMVGHTGDLSATIKAVEFVDLCLGKIYKAVSEQKGTLLITADHGNAEVMLNPKTNEIWAGHTTNPVPFILVSEEHKKLCLNQGTLGNIAPTIYHILNYKKLPKSLDKSLILLQDIQDLNTR